MKAPFPTLTPDEAAALIHDKDTIGFGGFTAAGACKVIPLAIAARANAEHAAGRPFKLGVITGASTGKSLDGALAAAEAIEWRTPYQSDPILRKLINEGKTRFFDLHLSAVQPTVRSGVFGPVHWAIIEASHVSPNGEIVLSTAVGAAMWLMVLARSAALMPLPMPRAASTLTWKSVRKLSRFCRTIRSIPSCCSRSPVVGTQMRPRPNRAMKFTAAGVTCCAAITRSPSFSRSASSTTMTIFPRRRSAMTDSMGSNCFFIWQTQHIRWPGKFQPIQSITLPPIFALGAFSLARCLGAS